MVAMPVVVKMARHSVPRSSAHVVDPEVSSVSKVLSASRPKVRVRCPHQVGRAKSDLHTVMSPMSPCVAVMGVRIFMRALRHLMVCHSRAVSPVSLKQTDRLPEAWGGGLDQIGAVGCIKSLFVG